MAGIHYQEEQSRFSDETTASLLKGLRTLPHPFHPPVIEEDSHLPSSPPRLLLRQSCSDYEITSFTFITAKYPVQMVRSAEANKEYISAVCVPHLFHLNFQDV